MQPATVVGRRRAPSHQGFLEVVKHGEAVKLFTGTAQADEVEALLAQDVSFPRVR